MLNLPQHHALCHVDRSTYGQQQPFKAWQEQCKKGASFDSKCGREVRNLEHHGVRTEREKKSVLKTLQTRKEEQKGGAHRVNWMTDSQNDRAFLNRGSTKVHIQKDVLEIMMLERDLGIINIIHIWQPWSQQWMPWLRDRTACASDFLTWFLSWIQKG